MEVDEIMNQVKDIEQRAENGTLQQSEAINGTLNEARESDELIKQGKIDDGSEYGKQICVVKQFNRAGEQYYSVYERVGYIAIADEQNKYDIYGAMNTNNKEYKVYGYKKSGTSQSGNQYEFISLVLHEKDDIKKVEKDDVPF